MSDIIKNQPVGEILLYQTEDGQTKIDVRLVNETIWLSLNQLAELFQRDKSVISRHIKNVFDEAELDPRATVANFATVQNEAGRDITRNIEYYNLDVIISVGYRVKSHRGTQFRIWATQRLREYLIKGFTMDDERLKNPGGRNYFEELLERIRDIRSSEKLFWKKVLEIYSTSIDYDPDTEMTKQFFATVQNKMHWAAHGQTAAEVIYNRADSKLPYLGLSHWEGAKPRQKDIKIAKNYLQKEELDTLNRIVTLYLEFAELQAINKKPMYMKDWIGKLNDFLKISDREILNNAGTISHEKAIEKALNEYKNFQSKTLNEPSQVEKHFDKALKKIKEIEKK
jgi:hypothetical protein